MRCAIAHRTGKVKPPGTAAVDQVLAIAKAKQL
jgi:hypothetical protein